MPRMELIELDENKAYMLPYAPAIKVPPGSEWVFLSGAIQPDHADELPDDVSEQTRRVMQRHTDVLAAHGLGWDDVVHVYEFLTDMRDTGPVHTMMAEFTGDSGWKPANTLIGVNALSRPGARFELDVVAVRTTSEGSN